MPDDISASGSIPASPEPESVRQPTAWDRHSRLSLGLVFASSVVVIYALFADEPKLCGLAYLLLSLGFWMDKPQSSNVARSEEVQAETRGKAKP